MTNKTRNNYCTSLDDKDSIVKENMSIENITDALLKINGKSKSNNCKNSNRNNITKVEEINVENLVEEIKKCTMKELKANI